MGGWGDGGVRGDFLPKAEPAPGNPPSSRTDLLGEPCTGPAMGLPESGAFLFSQALLALQEGRGTVFSGATLPRSGVWTKSVAFAFACSDTRFLNEILQSSGT